MEISGRTMSLAEFAELELVGPVRAPSAGGTVAERTCWIPRTRIDQRGFGLASSRLFDRDRLVARGAQALYIGRG
jgi:hypothetical protein